MPDRHTKGARAMSKVSDERSKVAVIVTRVCTACKHEEQIANPAATSRGPGLNEVLWLTLGMHIGYVVCARCGHIPMELRIQIEATSESTDRDDRRLAQQ
jgi:hypothetical protein